MKSFLGCCCWTLGNKGIISSIIPAANAPVSLVQGFQLNLTATHGNSGGPVFSLQSGKVFSILARGVFDSSGTQLLPGIVKAEPIYPVLNTQLSQSMKKAKPGEIPLPQE
jgi:hypothetical protein